MRLFLSKFNPKKLDLSPIVANPGEQPEFISEEGLSRFHEHLIRAMRHHSRKEHYSSVVVAKDTRDSLRLASALAAEGASLPKIREKTTAASRHEKDLRLAQDWENYFTKVVPLHLPKTWRQFVDQKLDGLMASKGNIQLAQVTVKGLLQLRDLISEVWGVEVGPYFYADEASKYLAQHFSGILGSQPFPGHVKPILDLITVFRGVAVQDKSHVSLVLVSYIRCVLTTQLQAIRPVDKDALIQNILIPLRKNLQQLFKDLSTAKDLVDYLHEIKGVLLSFENILIDLENNNLTEDKLGLLTNAYRVFTPVVREAFREVFLILKTTLEGKYVPSVVNACNEAVVPQRFPNEVANFIAFETTSVSVGVDGVTNDYNGMLFLRYLYTPRDLIEQAKELAMALQWVESAKRELNMFPEVDGVAISAELNAKEIQLKAAQKELAAEMLRALKNVDIGAEGNKDYNLTFGLSVNLFASLMEIGVFDVSQTSIESFCPTTFEEPHVNAFNGYIAKFGSDQVKAELPQVMVKFKAGKVQQPTPKVEFVSHGVGEIFNLPKPFPRAANNAAEDENEPKSLVTLVPAVRPGFPFSFLQNGHCYEFAKESKLTTRFNELLSLSRESLNLNIKVKLERNSRHLLLDWLEEADEIISSERAKLNAPFLSSLYYGADFIRAYSVAYAYAEGLVLALRQEAAAILVGRLITTLRLEKENFFSGEILAQYKAFISAYGDIEDKDKLEAYTNFENNFLARLNLELPLKGRVDFNINEEDNSKSNARYVTKSDSSQVASVNIKRIIHDAALCEKYSTPGEGVDREAPEAKKAISRVKAIQLIAAIITGNRFLRDPQFNIPTDSVGMRENLIASLADLIESRSTTLSFLNGLVAYISSQDIIDINDDQLAFIKAFKPAFFDTFSGDFNQAHTDLINWVTAIRKYEFFSAHKDDNNYLCLPGHEDLEEKLHSPQVVERYGSSRKKQGQHIYATVTRLLNMGGDLVHIPDFNKKLLALIAEIEGIDDKRLVKLEELLVNCKPVANNDVLAAYRIKLLECYYKVDKARLPLPRERFPSEHFAAITEQDRNGKFASLFGPRTKLLREFPCIYTAEQRAAIQKSLAHSENVQDFSLLNLTRKIIECGAEPEHKKKQLEDLLYHSLYNFLSYAPKLISFEPNQLITAQLSMSSNRKRLTDELEGIIPVFTKEQEASLKDLVSVIEQHSSKLEITNEATGTVTVTPITVEVVDYSNVDIVKPSVDGNKENSEKDLKRIKQLSIINNRDCIELFKAYFPPQLQKEAAFTILMYLLRHPNFVLEEDARIDFVGRLFKSFGHDLTNPATKRFFTKGELDQERGFKSANQVDALENAFKWVHQAGVSNSLWEGSTFDAWPILKLLVWPLLPILDSTDQYNEKNLTEYASQITADGREIVAEYCFRRIRAIFDGASLPQVLEGKNKVESENRRKAELRALRIIALTCFTDEQRKQVHKLCEVNQHVSADKNGRADLTDLVIELGNELQISYAANQAGKKKNRSGADDLSQVEALFDSIEKNNPETTDSVKLKIGEAITDMGRTFRDTFFGYSLERLQSFLDALQGRDEKVIVEEILIYLNQWQGIDANSKPVLAKIRDQLNKLPDGEQRRSAIGEIHQSICSLPQQAENGALLEQLRKNHLVALRDKVQESQETLVFYLNSVLTRCQVLWPLLEVGKDELLDRSTVMETAKHLHELGFKEKLCNYLLKADHAAVLARLATAPGYGVGNHARTHQIAYLNFVHYYVNAFAAEKVVEINAEIAWLMKEAAKARKNPTAYQKLNKEIQRQKALIPFYLPTMETQGKSIAERIKINIRTQVIKLIFAEPEVKFTQDENRVLQLISPEYYVGCTAIQADAGFYAAISNRWDEILTLNPFYRLDSEKVKLDDAKHDSKAKDWYWHSILPVLNSAQRLEAAAEPLNARIKARLKGLLLENKFLEAADIVVHIINIPNWNRQLNVIVEEVYNDYIREHLLPYALSESKVNADKRLDGFLTPLMRIEGAHANTLQGRVLDHLTLCLQTKFSPTTVVDDTTLNITRGVDVIFTVAMLAKEKFNRDQDLKNPAKILGEALLAKAKRAPAYQKEIAIAVNQAESAVRTNKKQIDALPWLIALLDVILTKVFTQERHEKKVSIQTSNQDIQQSQQGVREERGSFRKFFENILPSGWFVLKDQKPADKVIRQMGMEPKSYQAPLPSRGEILYRSLLNTVQNGTFANIIVKASQDKSQANGQDFGEEDTTLERAKASRVANALSIILQIPEVQRRLIAYYTREASKLPSEASFNILYRDLITLNTFSLSDEKALRRILAEWLFVDNGALNDERGPQFSVHQFLEPESPLVTPVKINGWQTIEEKQTKVVTSKPILDELKSSVVEFKSSIEQNRTIFKDKGKHYIVVSYVLDEVNSFIIPPEAIEGLTPQKIKIKDKSPASERISPKATLSGSPSPAGSVADVAGVRPPVLHLDESGLGRYKRFIEQPELNERHGLRRILEIPVVKQKLIAHWDNPRNSTQPSLASINAILAVPAINPSEVVSGLAGLFLNNRNSFDDCKVEIQAQLGGKGCYKRFIDQLGLTTRHGLRTIFEIPAVREKLIGHWDNPSNNMPSLASIDAILAAPGIINFSEVVSGLAALFLNNPNSFEDCKVQIQEQLDAGGLGLYKQFIEQPELNERHGLLAILKIPAVKQKLIAHWDNPRNGAPSLALLDEKLVDPEITSTSEMVGVLAEFFLNNLNLFDDCKAKIQEQLDESGWVRYKAFVEQPDLIDRHGLRTILEIPSVKQKLITHWDNSLNKPPSLAVVDAMLTAPGIIQNSEVAASLAAGLLNDRNSFNECQREIQAILDQKENDKTINDLIGDCKFAYFIARPEFTRCPPLIALLRQLAVSDALKKYWNTHDLPDPRDYASLIETLSSFKAETQELPDYKFENRNPNDAYSEILDELINLLIPGASREETHLLLNALTFDNRINYEVGRAILGWARYLTYVDLIEAKSNAEKDDKILSRLSRVLMQDSVKMHLIQYWETHSLPLIDSEASEAGEQDGQPKVDTDPSSLCLIFPTLGDVLRGDDTHEAVDNYIEQALRQTDKPFAAPHLLKVLLNVPSFRSLIDQHLDLIGVQQREHKEKGFEASLITMESNLISFISKIPAEEENIDVSQTLPIISTALFGLGNVLERLIRDEEFIRGVQNYIDQLPRKAEVVKEVERPVVSAPAPEAPKVEIRPLNVKFDEGLFETNRIKLLHQWHAERPFLHLSLISRDYQSDIHLYYSKTQRHISRAVGSLAALDKRLASIITREDISKVAGILDRFFFPTEKGEDSVFAKKGIVPYHAVRIVNEAVYDKFLETLDKLRRSEPPVVDDATVELLGQDVVKHKFIELIAPNPEFNTSEPLLLNSLLTNQAELLRVINLHKPLLQQEFAYHDFLMRLEKYPHLRAILLNPADQTLKINIQRAVRCEAVSYEEIQANLISYAEFLTVNKVEFDSSKLARFAAKTLQEIAIQEEVDFTVDTCKRNLRDVTLYDRFIDNLLALAANEKDQSHKDEIVEILISLKGKGYEFIRAKYTEFGGPNGDHEKFAKLFLAAVKYEKFLRRLTKGSRDFDYLLGIETKGAALRFMGNMLAVKKLTGEYCEHYHVTSPLKGAPVIDPVREKLIRTVAPKEKRSASVSGENGDSKWIDLFAGRFVSELLQAHENDVSAAPDKHEREFVAEAISTKLLGGIGKSHEIAETREAAAENRDKKFKFCLTTTDIRSQLDDKEKINRALGEARFQGLVSKLAKYPALQEVLSSNFIKGKLEEYLRTHLPPANLEPFLKAVDSATAVKNDGNVSSAAAAQEKISLRTVIGEHLLGNKKVLDPIGGDYDRVLVSAEQENAAIGEVRYELFINQEGFTARPVLKSILSDHKGELIKAWLLCGAPRGHVDFSVIDQTFIAAVDSNVVVNDLNYRLLDHTGYNLFKKDYITPKLFKQLHAEAKYQQILIYFAADTQFMALLKINWVSKALQSYLEEHSYADVLTKKLALVQALTLPGIKHAADVKNAIARILWENIAAPEHAEMSDEAAQKLVTEASYLEFINRDELKRRPKLQAFLSTPAVRNKLIVHWDRKELSAKDRAIANTRVPSSLGVLDKDLATKNGENLKVALAQAFFGRNERGVHTLDDVSLDDVQARHIIAEARYEVICKDNEIYKDDRNAAILKEYLAETELPANSAHYEAIIGSAHHAAFMKNIPELRAIVSAEPLCSNLKKHWLNYNAAINSADLWQQLEATTTREGLKAALLDAFFGKGNEKKEVKDNLRDNPEFSITEETFLTLQAHAKFHNYAQKLQTLTLPHLSLREIIKVSEVKDALIHHWKTNHTAPTMEQLGELDAALNSIDPQSAIGKKLICEALAGYFGIPADRFGYAQPPELLLAITAEARYATFMQKVEVQEHASLVNDLLAVNFGPRDFAYKILHTVNGSNISSNYLVDEFNNPVTRTALTKYWETHALPKNLADFFKEVLNNADLKQIDSLIAAVDKALHIQGCNALQVQAKFKAADLRRVECENITKEIEAQYAIFMQRKEVQEHASLVEKLLAAGNVITIDGKNISWSYLVDEFKNPKTKAALIKHWETHALPKDLAAFLKEILDDGDLNRIGSLVDAVKMAVKIKEYAEDQTKELDLTRLEEGRKRGVQSDALMTLNAINEVNTTGPKAVSAFDACAQSFDQEHVARANKANYELALKSAETVQANIGLFNLLFELDENVEALLIQYSREIGGLTGIDVSKWDSSKNIPAASLRELFAFVKTHDLAKMGACRVTFTILSQFFKLFDMIGNWFEAKASEPKNVELAINTLQEELNKTRYMKKAFYAYHTNPGIEAAIRPVYLQQLDHELNGNEQIKLSGGQLVDKGYLGFERYAEALVVMDEALANQGNIQQFVIPVVAALEKLLKVKSNQEDLSAYRARMQKGVSLLKAITGSESWRSPAVNCNALRDKVLDLISAAARECLLQQEIKLYADIFEAVYKSLPDGSNHKDLLCRNLVIAFQSLLIEARLKEVCGLLGLYKRLGEREKAEFKKQLTELYSFLRESAPVTDKLKQQYQETYYHPLLRATLYSTLPPEEAGLILDGFKTNLSTQHHQLKFKLISIDVGSELDEYKVRRLQDTMATCMSPGEHGEFLRKLADKLASFNNVKQALDFYIKYEVAVESSRWVMRFDDTLDPKKLKVFIALRQLMALTQSETTSELFDSSSSASQKKMLTQGDPKGYLAYVVLNGNPDEVVMVRDLWKKLSVGKQYNDDAAWNKLVDSIKSDVNSADRSNALILGIPSSNGSSPGHSTAPSAQISRRASVADLREEAAPATPSRLARQESATQIFEGSSPATARANGGETKDSTAQALARLGSSSVNIRVQTAPSASVVPPPLPKYAPPPVPVASPSVLNGAASGKGSPQKLVSPAKKDVSPTMIKASDNHLCLWNSFALILAKNIADHRKSSNFNTLALIAKFYETWKLKNKKVDLPTFCDYFADLYNRAKYEQIETELQNYFKDIAYKHLDNDVDLKEANTENVIARLHSKIEFLKNKIDEDKDYLKSHKLDFGRDLVANYDLRGMEDVIQKQIVRLLDIPGLQLEQMKDHFTRWWKQTMEAQYYDNLKAKVVWAGPLEIEAVSLALNIRIKVAGGSSSNNADTDNIAIKWYINFLEKKDGAGNRVGHYDPWLELCTVTETEIKEPAPTPVPAMP